VRFIGLGGDNQSGGILVQPVHNPRAQNPANAGKIMAMKKQRIDECLVRIAGCRMHHHSCRFVNHNDRAVFINNI